MWWHVATVTVAVTVRITWINIVSIAICVAVVVQAARIATDQQWWTIWTVWSQMTLFLYHTFHFQGT